MTSRRDFLRFLGMGAALIAVPQFGRWHRQGPLFVPHQATDGLYNAEIYSVLDATWFPLSRKGEWYNTGRLFERKEAVFSDWRAVTKIPGLSDAVPVRGTLATNGLIYVPAGSTLTVNIPPVEIRFE